MDYCVETCRPYFTQLMTVRREGDYRVDYRVGIWSLGQYSLRIVFLWVLQFLLFGLDVLDMRKEYDVRRLELLSGNMLVFQLGG